MEGTADEEVTKFVLVIMMMIYFAPVIVAFSRKIHSKWAVGVFTFFLGWTGIGWLILIIYASFVRGPKQEPE